MSFLPGLGDMMGVVDGALASQWREEDLLYRELETRRRVVDDTRRAVDEKAEQLKAISSLSALIAGFAMIAQTNLGIPSNLNTVLLVFFGFDVACVVGLNMIAMLNATFILIAIYKYDTNACLYDPSKTADSFRLFWETTCEKDWNVAFTCFSLGIPLFLILLTLTSWIDFWIHPDGYMGGYTVTGVCILTLLFWFFSSQHKWGRYLSKSKHSQKQPFYHTETNELHIISTSETSLSPAQSRCGLSSPKPR